MLAERSLDQYQRHALEREKEIKRTAGRIVLSLMNHLDEEHHVFRATTIHTIVLSSICREEESLGTKVPVRRISCFNAWWLSP